MISVKTLDHISLEKRVIYGHDYIVYQQKKLLIFYLKNNENHILKTTTASTNALNNNHAYHIMKTKHHKQQNAENNLVSSNNFICLNLFLNKASIAKPTYIIANTCTTVTIVFFFMSRTYFPAPLKKIMRIVRVE